MMQLLPILSAVCMQLVAPTGPAEPSIVPPVRVMETGEHNILPGVVRPSGEVTLSVPFDTLLGEVHVAEGQLVSRGEIVAVLDDRVVRAALQVAEVQAQRTAQVDRARIALDRADDTLNRIRTIHGLNAAAEPELVAAKAERDIAAADLRSAEEAQTEAQASLELARARYEEHLVRAPFDAIVVRVHAKLGAMISPGEPLLELASVDGLRVDLYLPVSIAAELYSGERYTLMVEDPIPAVIVACVRYVEPRMDPVSRTMRVVFDLGRAESHARLYPGALASPATRHPVFAGTSTPSAPAVNTWAQRMTE